MVSPGATREQIVAKFGEPIHTVDRPGDSPTPEAWRDAIQAKIGCLKPGHIASMVLSVEYVNGQSVHRLETYSPPDHIQFLERLDFLYGVHLEAVYYNADGRVVTSEFIPEHIFTD